MRNGIRRPAVGLLLSLLASLLLTPAALAQGETTYLFPDDEGSWAAPGSHVGRTATEPVRAEIVGVGRFEVHPGDVEQLRPDIFRPGWVSVFDVIAHLGEAGQIDLAYHYDDAMATHVIDELNGTTGWWYEARYDGGWFERNVHRMDLYPVKDGTAVRLFADRPTRWEQVHRTFTDEVARLEENEGVLILPAVEIRGARGVLTFENVVVTPHNVRSDMLQPGVITALDIPVSLGEQGKLSIVGLTWYDRIGSADPVDHYFIERVEAEGFLSQASGGCGFVYEVGPTLFAGFAGSHIHIPTDARVMVSPEYAEWFWLCL